MTEQTRHLGDETQGVNIPGTTETSRIIRVDTGITAKMLGVKFGQRRPFFLPLRVTKYEQSYEARKAVIATVNPTVLDCRVTREGNGGQDIKQLPKGTKVVLGVWYPETSEKDSSSSRLLVLGGVTLDSDTPVNGFGGSFYNQPEFWTFDLTSPNGLHFEREEEIKNAQTFMSKYPELLDQGDIKLELDRVRRISFMLGVNEIVIGRFNNLSEYRTWWKQNMTNTWDTVSKLRERLKTAGVLEKDEENPNTLKYRQKHSQEYGEFYEASFSDDICEVEVHSRFQYGSRSDTYVISKGDRITSGCSTFLSTPPYGADGGSRSSSTELDRDGIVRYDFQHDKKPSDPNRPVDIYSNITTFEEFSQMCDKIGNSTQGTNHPSE